MHTSARKPQPPLRHRISSQVWRWFWRGLGIWTAVALVIGFALAGQVAPLLREARNGVVAITTASSAARPQTANLAPMPHTGGNPYGINTFLYQEVEEEKIRRSLTMIKEAGFGFIREQIAWQEFERGQKGNFRDERWDNRSTWINMDRLVRLVEESGLQMIARVDYPPDWARAGRNPWHATPPANFDDYGDFLQVLATRYPSLKYFQIWNEPNLTIEWGMQNVDPAAYARLLQAAYTRLKATNPEAVVIAAALAPTIEKGPQNMNDLLFLRKLYEAGARDYFDILSVNPYGLRSGPDDRRFSDEDTNFSRPVRAREIMVEFGDANKPIWASETGWNALPPDYPADPLYGRASAEQQARYTVRAYERVLQEWPWLGTMALWHFRMTENRLAVQQSYYFGVVGDDFTPRPVYEAMKDLATRPPIVYPGFRQEDHRALAYAGEWREGRDAQAVLGGYRETSKPGAAVRFGFWGTDLDLVVRRGAEAGTLAVTVDGQAARANLLSRGSNGQAIADLKAPGAEWGYRLPVARHLTPGEHEVEVALVGGGSLALDGVVVQAQAAREPSPLPLLLALILGLLVFAFWSRRGGPRP